MPYNHQDCIDLIERELINDPTFLPLPRAAIPDYYAKIDQNTCFEKQYKNGEIAGFIAFYCSDTLSKEAFITMMLIDKKYRRLRIATQLLYQVMITLKDKGFERCSLAVRLHNAKAIALYKGYGFVATHSDADSLFMTLQL